MHLIKENIATGIASSGKRLASESNARSEPRLISDSTMCEWLGGISSVTLWRRSKSDPDFPPLIKVNGRNYRSADEARAYVGNLIASARGGA
jgi:hypothetical protein